MADGAAQTRRARLLVVDDDPATVRMLRDWFNRSPYEILDAARGDDGLALARRELPDVILLDLTMPGLDGISVARQLKDDAATSTIPVLLVTARRDVESKVRAFDVGADDYVVKPFECAEIEARVEALLRRREQMEGLRERVDVLETDRGRLEQLLLVDEKTGLFNFRAFRRRLREEWQRAERYDMTLSLVFLDLDHFKSVNDTLGHQAGDRVLAEFATLVTGGARANDVAARYGGEEFAIILPHTDGEMAARVAERVRRAVREFVFFADESPTRITVSAGVATYLPGVGPSSVDDLIRAADRALYAAKDAGRDRVLRDGEPAGSAQLDRHR